MLIGWREKAREDTAETSNELKNTSEPDLGLARLPYAPKLE
jgi:hypothetical protein